MYGSDRDTPQKMSIWSNNYTENTEVRISLITPKAQNETQTSDFNENSKTTLSNQIKPLQIDSFVDDINEFVDSDQLTRSPRTRQRQQSPSARGR